MINVSCLKSIYDKEKTVKLLNEIDKVDMIHLDLMDGLYAGENNIDLDELYKVFQENKKPLDVHLMVNNPENIIDDIFKLNPDTIIFHPDASSDSIALINKIKTTGYKCGIAFDTPVSIIDYKDLLDQVDIVLLMSVKAGYGGQEFLKETYEKLNNYCKNYEDITEIPIYYNDAEITEIVN